MRTSYLPTLLLPAVLAACGVPSEGPQTAAPTVGPAPEAKPDGARLRRLTQVQYKRSLQSLFGADLVLPVALEPDTREIGFQTIGASSTSISPRGVEQYETAAYDVAEQVVAWPDRLGAWMPCALSELNADCTASLAATLGRRAWRRPLTNSEVERLSTLMLDIAAQSGEAEVGVTYGIAAILQDPRFLYRVELGVDDGAGGRVLTDLELASRLSFLLWNTLPDETLLAAAEAGQLQTEEGLRDSVARLLEDPQSRDGLANFFTELYQLDLLDSITKDPQKVPQASPEVGPAARRETLAVIDRIVFDDNADFRTLLTTRETFIDRRLAAIYGVPAPDVENAAWTTLPETGERRGVLGHVSFLMLNAHNSTSSATLRGKFVRERLLCQTMPAPPPGVNTNIPEADEDAPTLRDRVAVHLEDPACAGCHELMDPIGLGFENFDAIGRWRLTEAGAMIDPTGQLDGAAFDDAWEMASVVAQHPQFAPCLARNLYQYMAGQPVSEGEEAYVDWLGETMAVDEYRVQSLVLRIVESPAFQRVGEPQ